VLGQVGRLDADALEQRTHRQFSILEALGDVDTRGMSQGLEDFSLEASERYLSVTITLGRRFLANLRHCAVSQVYSLGSLMSTVSYAGTGKALPASDGIAEATIRLARFGATDASFTGSLPNPSLFG